MRTKPAYYYHNCPVCQKLFIPRNNKQKFCCKAHANKASRAKLAQEREFYRACDFIDKLIADCSREPQHDLCIELQTRIAKLHDRIEHALDVHPEAAKFKRNVRTA